MRALAGKRKSAPDSFEARTLPSSPPQELLEDTIDPRTKTGKWHRRGKVRHKWAKGERSLARMEFIGSGRATYNLDVWIGASEDESRR